MKFLGLLIILCAASLIVVIAVVVLLSLRRRGEGISKDYAEQIVMRCFVHGRTIGARFTREGHRWLWEFDVLDGEQIHRTWVDARTRAIIASRDLRPGESSYKGRNKVLGKRID
jgi:hypothetical protein